MSAVPVTVFSSIPNIAKSLRSHLPTLEEVVDPALGGYGGTVEFCAEALQARTRQQLRMAQILITEPAVLAEILEKDPDAVPNLQWCQSTYAGVYVDRGITPNAHLTF